jgi:hypothetical protein
MEIISKSIFDRTKIQRAKKAQELKGEISYSGVSEDAVPTTETPQAQSLLNLSSIDALFLSIDESHKDARKAFVYGNHLLDKLEGLKTDIIMGRLSPQRLEDIQDQLKNRTADILDPKLKEIICEIEIRAAVELAKFDKEKG